MAAVHSQAVQDRADKIRSLAIGQAERGQGVPEGRSRVRTLAGGALLAAALAAAWYAGQHGASTGTGAANTPAPPAAAQGGANGSAVPGGPAAHPSAASARAGVKFEAQGFVTATRHATVSTRVAGIVRSVNVEAGDRVKEGQILGTLDADLAQRELQLAEGQVQVLASRVTSAEAQLRQARSDLAQEEQLYQQKFSSSARLTARQTAADIAQAAVQSARSDLEVARLQVQQQRSMLSNYTIRAPFAGIVTEKNAQMGELIAPSGAGGGFTRTGLCTIVDTNSLEVVVDVSEQLVTQVKPGQPAELTLYAYEGTVIKGQVSRIMPSADRAKGTLQVRLSILDKDPRILPDMRARVSFL